MIKGREGRTHCDPEEKQSTHESSNPQDRNQVRKSTSKTQPATQVKQCDENQNTSKRQRRRPPLEVAVDFCRDGQNCIHGRGEMSLAPSTTVREASCAGACPAGCSVLRNATSAVVSAGLRFLP